VRDALSGSLDNALSKRGGFWEVHRRSSGHPTHFGIRLEFILPDNRAGFYAFQVGAFKGEGKAIPSRTAAGHRRYDLAKLRPELVHAQESNRQKKGT